MTYLPELKDSLVKAAGHIAHDDGAKPRRVRLTFGGVATALATATAIAIAAIALIAFHHGGSHTPSGGSTPAGHEQAAREAASQLLGQVVLPAGAVKTGLRRGIPADLWKPSDLLPTPHRVDVYGVWRLPQSPRQVLRFIEAHRPPGSTQGWSGEAGSSSGGATPAGAAGAAPRRGFTLQGATVTFNFPLSGRTRIWKELAVQIEALSSGGSALRADAEAASLEPRPAGERIPAGIKRVQVTTTAPHAGHLERRTSSVTDTRQIKGLVSILNALPVVQRPAVRCPGLIQAQMRFAFYSGSSAPTAIAVFDGHCDRLQLVLGARRWPDLQLNPGDGGLRGAEQLKELLTFGAGLPRGGAQRGPG